MKVGDDLNVRAVGYHALDSLRSEKGYRHWGDDLTPGDTPFEAGVGFAVKLGKASAFKGKDALAKQKAEGVERRMVHFKLETPDSLLFGGEPILFDGKVVGHLTSVSYGFTVKAAIGMGDVECPREQIQSMLEAGGFQLDIAAQPFTAAASLTPFLDPAGKKIKL